MVFIDRRTNKLKRILDWENTWNWSKLLWVWSYHNSNVILIDYFLTAFAWIWTEKFQFYRVLTTWKLNINLSNFCQPQILKRYALLLLHIKFDYALFFSWKLRILFGILENLEFKCVSFFLFSRCTNFSFARLSIVH